MCFNHRTIHKPCHHIHERITLCQYAIKPLVRRATTFPYLQPLQMPPQHPITGDEKHNVTCTAEESNEPCEDCRLPDLDIFRLEEMTKELGYRVSVDVDDGSDKIAVVTKREVTNSFEAAGKQLRDAKETEVDLKCEVVHLLRKEKLCGSAGANETASMMALPYTIGLGLLVAVKNVKAKAEEDRATRKRKRTAKL